MIGHGRLLQAVGNAVAQAGGGGTWTQDVARFVIVLVANFPMGVTGFGDAIIMHIALTLCNLGLPGVCNGAISEAVFNLTVGGLAAMGVQAALIHNHTNWKLVWLLLPPILVGTGVGMAVLYHVHSLWLKRVLGLVFLSVACYQIHGEVTRVKASNSNNEATQHSTTGSGPLDVTRVEVRAAGIVAGAISGILAGLFGTGGPPLMVFVSTFEVNKDEWRASNAIIWFIDDLFRLFYIAVIQQQLHLESDGGLLVSLFVAGGLGVWLGSVVSPRVDMVLFRRLLILLLLLGANVMLLTGVSPVVLALGGVLAILGGVALYATALYHEPSNKATTSTGVGSGWVQEALVLLGLEGWGDTSTQRGRVGGVRYTRVATDDHDTHTPHPTQRIDV